MKLHHAGSVALVCASFVLALPGRAAPPDDDGLDEVLARFAAVTGLEASFREEKRFALLDAPLESEGTIHYAPGRFARHTTRPAVSSVVVTGDRLEFGDGEGRQELDMASRPAVKPFVDSFLAVLRGDRSALEAIHRLEWHAPPARADGGCWRLILRPRVAPMNRVIDRLEVEGRGVQLTRMLLVETGGDETDTTFHDVDAARVYTAEEAARIFRLPGRRR